MARSTLLALAALAATAAAQGTGPMPTTCNGKPNLFDIESADSPTFIAKAPNGVKLQVTQGTGGGNYTNAPLTVLHVYGTAYEMGVAYGTLMRAEITDLLPKVQAYMAEQINASIGFLPDPLRTWVETVGLEAALNLTYEATKPFTPVHFLDTLQGLSDGTGLPYMSLVHVTMIPELIKAQCSIVGAWGEANQAGSSPGDLVQLRALDWDTNGPFQEYPLLITYHPSAGEGSNFTVLTWAGLIGAITGWSSSGLSISEKVWIAYKGTENILGTPFHFVLQDMLQYDADVDAALSRIASTERTCSVWMGIGDNKASSGPFKAVGYSNQEVEIYNDQNFPAYPNHDRFNDLLFINKHVQPSDEPCMNDVLHWLYGNVTALNIVQYVTALEQTGDMHIAAYSHGDKVMYLSNASPGDGSGNGVVNAYDRPFLRFDMAKLWATDLASF